MRLKSTSLYFALACLSFSFIGCGPGGSANQGATSLIVDPGPVPLNDGKVVRYLEKTPSGISWRGKTVWKDHGVFLDPKDRIYDLAVSLEVVGRSWLNKTQQFKPVSGRKGYVGPEYHGVAVVVSLEPDITIASIRKISPTHPENPFSDWLDMSRSNGQR